MTTNTALITGASKGLGRSLMARLNADGWNVAGVARTEVELLAAVEALDGPGRAVGIVGDVGRPEDAARIVGETAARLGPVDLVVHAASTLGPTPLRGLLELTDDAFDRVLQVNVGGPFRLTKLIAGSMALRGGGHVVFVSSDAAVEAYPGWGAYGSSKAALDHLARIWATEVPEVRFLAVDPGEMDTDMHAAAMPDADRSVLQRPDDVAARILRMLGDAPSGTRVAVSA